MLKLIKLLWKTFKLLKFALVTLLLVLSLSFIVLDKTTDLFKTALKAGTKVSTETAQLLADNNKLKTKVATLTDEAAILAGKNKKLVANVAKHSAFVKRLTASTAIRVSRAGATQAGNVASAWFPYAGTVIAGGFITWEIYDACTTLDYINELQMQLDSSLEPTTCGINWQSELEVIKIAGADFVEIAKDELPEGILESLIKLSDDVDGWKTISTIDEYVMHTDKNGKHYIMDIGYVFNKFYVSLEP